MCYDYETSGTMSGPRVLLCAMTKLAGDSTLALDGLLVQSKARKAAVEADLLTLALSRGLLLTARRASESEQRDAGEHLDETER